MAASTIPKLVWIVTKIMFMVINVYIIFIHLELYIITWISTTVICIEDMLIIYIVLILICGELVV